MSNVLPRYADLDLISVGLGLSPELFNYIVVAGTWFDPPDDPEIPLADPPVPGHCFETSWSIAMLDRDYQYVQGIALAPPPAWAWVHHAWNVRADGSVLDTTWGTGAAYYGVTMRYRPDLHTALQNARTPLHALLRPVAVTPA